MMGQLEEDQTRQRAEIKKVEGRTRQLQLQADELRAKLKEKETLLRIAKFKLSEVHRGIKQGQKVDRHRSQESIDTEKRALQKGRGNAAGMKAFQRVSSPSPNPYRHLTKKITAQKEQEESKKQEEKTKYLQQLDKIKKDQQEVLTKLRRQNRSQKQLNSI